MNDIAVGFAVGMGVGEEQETDDPKFQRVDATAAKGTGPEVRQNVAAHEAGHMFGLGDEYVEEVPPKDVLAKFQGDRASHDADVRSTMGDEAADELLVQVARDDVSWQRGEAGPLRVLPHGTEPGDRAHLEGGVMVVGLPDGAFLAWRYVDGHRRIDRCQIYWDDGRVEALDDTTSELVCTSTATRSRRPAAPSSTAACPMPPTGRGATPTTRLRSRIRGASRAGTEHS